MKTVLFACLIALRTLSAMAQVPSLDTTNGRPYYILLKDGSHIFGRIVRRDSTMYTVKMRSGQLTYLERELFKAISSTAPVSGDSTVYFAPVITSKPTTTTGAPNQYVVTLIDGTVLRGLVLSQDSTRLVLKTNDIGTIYVPAERIERMEKYGARQRSRYVSAHPAEGYPNLFPQYMFLTPTAFQAERGRTYYRNSLVYLNQIDAGITDNWSMGVGLALIPPVIAAGWISSKLSVALGSRARIGVQGQYIFGGTTTGFRDNSFGGSYVQGLLSLGTSQKNLTIGLGRPLDGNASGALLTVGLVRKVGPLLTLITENQVVLNSGGYTVGRFSGGLRLDRQRHSFDLSANLYAGFFGGNRYGVSLWQFAPLAAYQLRLGK